MKTKLAVLISGGGRTLLNLQKCINNGTLDATIALVISSRHNAKGVKRSKDLGLPTKVISKSFLSPEDFQQGVTAAIVDANVDLVCMAGFLSLWKIPERWQNRVLNIHPALLPDFGGRGMYGNAVHKAVLDAKRLVSGCTVHYCNNEYDSGPIILQRTVDVMPDDTPDSLAERVFAEECIAYPEAIRKVMAKNRITWEYMVIDEHKHGSPDNEFELNELGKEGWELTCSRGDSTGNRTWYFKRRISTILS